MARDHVENEKCPCCVAREIIENCVRSFLKENEVTHLDAIISLVQTHNKLMSMLEKKLGKNGLISELKRLDDEDTMNLSLAMHLSLNINDMIERIQES